MAKPDKEVLEQFVRDVADRNVSRRDLMKRAAAIGLAAPAAGAVLQTRVVGVDAQATEPTGKLIVSMSVEPDTLENWKAYSTDGHPILRNVQEALLNRDPKTNELVGELATSWEQTDERTWRFTLRQGVTFHNGDPFNAEVAAYGINYTWSPEHKFEIYQFIGPDITATAVDEYTIDVATVEPDPILPARLYFSPIPNMKQVQERPDSLVTEPIGTGPYSFVEWNRGQYIRITANPDWWGLGSPDARGTVTIKDAEFVFRAESTVRAAQVVAGEAQIGRFLAPEDCETTPNCKSVSSVETIFLRLDTNHVAMKDIRVRQAIAFAVDKQSIADQLFGGGEPASQLVGPSATGYNADLQPYPYDLEKAKQLVEEAKAAGVPVDAEITVVTREGIYLRNDELAEYVATQLREIGLKAKSEVIEPALYNPEYSKNIKDVPETRGWITTNPHGNEIMDVSATASSYYRCDGGASMYCDPALDEALNKAIPLTGEERGPALAAVTKMYYDAYASVPVIYMPLNYGLAVNLQWEPRLDAFMLLKEMTLTA
ncbi:MAG: peptide/nickel transport system substrate-binding protein [Thermomicrobiales bacterium]|nr:peptide/nickel transport system substrate-binding protein [Thermomicrobiales bacterium]